MKRKVLVVHNHIRSNPTPDEADVLMQVESVNDTLVNLGYDVATASASLDLASLRKIILDKSPDIIFNLVESLDGEDRYAPVAAMVFESLGIPFTGSSSSSLAVTSDKCMAKKIMQEAGIPTPEWEYLDSLAKGTGSFWPCIIKSTTDHASIGINDASVIANHEEMSRWLADNPGIATAKYFAERYVDGREFNMALIEDGCGGVEVLNAAEIMFRDFPTGKPRIVGYAAKWDESAFEYQNTVRIFANAKEDQMLHEALAEIARKCFKVFSLRGYARVDFRVDTSGKPYVLEINANPCLSPDAGFFAACREMGIDSTEIVRRICAAAHCQLPHA